MERVSFETVDGVTIVGNRWPGGNKAVLLLHMMPATRSSWNEFAEALHRDGFTVLAIDLRGHGDSIKQGSKILNYKIFSDEQHQGSIRDVDSAVGFLQENGARQVFIAGASIGANLALWYQTDNKEISKTILLSPGLNYRGIQTQPLVSKLAKNQKAFVVAGDEDPHMAPDAETTVKTLAKSSNVEWRIYPSTAEHGTDLFSVDGTLIDYLSGWLSE